MRDEFIAALTELASTDPNIVLLTGDLGFGVLEQFSDLFPRQFINCGVAEQNMAGVACGLALEGKKVYTYSIGNFNTLRSLEQIRNDICYHNANVTIVSVGAGFSYGQLGMSHFAIEDLAIMRALPGMKVYCPADTWEIPDLTRHINSVPGPKYLRVDKSQAGSPNLGFDGGKVRVIKKGADLVLFGCGGIVSELMTLSSELDDLGVASTVAVVPTLKPLDVDSIIDLLRSARCVITLEEHSLIGGLGASISDLSMENGIFPDKFLKFGIQDFYPSIVGDQRYLRSYCGLTSSAILHRLRQLGII